MCFGIVCIVLSLEIVLSVNKLNFNMSDFFLGLITLAKIAEDQAKDILKFVKRRFEKVKCCSLKILTRFSYKSGEM